MSYSISNLLTRNLHDVFGENDPRASTKHESGAHIVGVSSAVDAI